MTNGGTGRDQPLPPAVILILNSCLSARFGSLFFFSAICNRACLLASTLCKLVRASSFQPQRRREKRVLAPRLRNHPSSAACSEVTRPTHTFAAIAQSEQSDTSGYKALVRSNSPTSAHSSAGHTRNRDSGSDILGRTSQESPTPCISVDESAYHPVPPSHSPLTLLAVCSLHITLLTLPRPVERPIRRSDFIVASRVFASTNL